METVVYRHRRLDNFSIFYIGIGNKNRPFYKSHRNKHWNNIVEKCDYSVEIVYKGLSWEDAAELEQLLISSYGRKDKRSGNLCNMTDGGEGAKGRKMTEKNKEILKNISRNRIYSKEDREKISIIKKNISEETRLKMSIAKKNMSKETKEKIGAYNRGKKQSPENIEKRRAGMFGAKAKIIINTLTGEEYKGIKTVSDKFGYKYNSLANMLNGHRKNNSIFIYKL